ncbi:MAG: MATE family efflux transporter [Actinomycetota bacterium]|nr:MATE family efflux transporter [Actinomycetota bacterium]
MSQQPRLARRLPVRPGRHRDDRAIVALALPALGALAADPLYSLIDTAFVGHLGAVELGAVAVGTAAFTASFWLFSFLAYGVTPRVARAVGRDDPHGAARIGVQALLLAAALGAIVLVAGLVLAGPVVRLLGAGPRVASFAEPYLRIRILSAPALLIGLVGHGWLRGAQNTKTPLYVAGAGALFNVALDYVLIYPVGLGVEGSAWGTVIGQWGVAVAFLVLLVPRFRGVPARPDPGIIRSLLSVGADLVIRTGVLLAALTVATSVATRMGVVALGSWQVTMQIFLLLAFTLDSIAIAGQALVGRYLGAGERSRAREVGVRLMAWGLTVGVALMVALLALREPIAALFTDDARVVQATVGLLAWLALTQPLSAAAFTLDGILIGASDTRYLAFAMVGCSLLYMALALGALSFEWGTAGLATGATAWLAARTAVTALRFRGHRWALQP